MAGAVILRPDCYVAGIADSKVLTAEERAALRPHRRRRGLVAVATVDAGEIDRINIHRASLECDAQGRVAALDPHPG
jgi:ribonuclease HII